MADKTVTVKRANVILRIPEDSVDRYLDQGYSVIDNYGNVIKASVPNDMGTLRKAYIENAEKIKRLEVEVEQLKAELLAKPKNAEPIKEKSSKGRKKAE